MTDALTIKLAAPAKLNLGLKVIGQRPDGYHQLETVMQELGLCDEVTVKVKPWSGPEPFNITMGQSNISLPEGLDNLCWRAAHLFLSKFPCPLDLEIGLIARIPQAAGMGGGSSDGAAVLRALDFVCFDLNLDQLTGQLKALAEPVGLLREKFGYDQPAQVTDVDRVDQLISIKSPLDGLTDESRQRLADLAGQLGADVSFFLYGATCFCEGIGELIQPLTRLTSVPCLICKPNFPVSTPWAFKTLHQVMQVPRLESNRCPHNREAWSAWNDLLAKIAETGNLQDLADLASNDFEPAILKNFPFFSELKRALATCSPDFLAMTGSGPSLFALFNDEDQALQAKQKMDRLYADTCFIHLTETV